MAHMWTEKSVDLETTSRMNEAAQATNDANLPTRRVEFNGKTLVPGGLCWDALQATPAPLQSSTCSAFIRVLRLVVSNRLARAILNRPSRDVEGVHLARLFKCAEDILEKEEISPTSRWQYFLAFRVILFHCATPLQNGQTVAEIGTRYSSRLAEPAHRSRREKTRNRRTKIGEAFAESRPLSSSVERDTLTGAEQFLRFQMDAFLIPCERFINEFKASRDALDRILLTDFPAHLVGIRLHNRVKSNKNVSEASLIKVPEDVLNWFIVHYVEKYRFFESGGREIPYSRSEMLKTFASEPTACFCFESALSQYYLTRRTMWACIVILLCKTTWNSSTLRGLTRDRIEPLGSGYLLKGLKPKTNQLQSVTLQKQLQGEESNVDKADIQSHIGDSVGSDGLVEEAVDADEVADVVVRDSLAVEAIRLVLWHDANVTKYGHRTTDSVFTFLNLNIGRRRIFSLGKWDKLAAQFFRVNELPIIPLSEFRNLRINYEFVAKNGNVLAAQLIAGHKSAETTQIYLEGHANLLISESSIRRFMRILGKSILFAVGRSDLHGDPDEAAARRLLFPFSFLQTRKSGTLADDWLESAGKSAIEIGLEEVEQCVFQRHFYLSHFRLLRSLNEQGFKAIHLPRIAFCEALYRLIKRSPLSAHLRLIEEKLNGVD